MRRCIWRKVAVGTLAVACSLWIWEGRAAAQNMADQTTLRLVFSFKGRATEAWEGNIELSQGRLVGLSLAPAQAGAVKQNAWRVRGRKPGAQRQQRRAGTPELLATLDAPSVTAVSVNTSRGSFSFALGDLRLGRALVFLDGQVRAERVPTSTRLTSGPDDEDLPAAAKGPDGSVWVAYMAYQHGQPIDNEAVHERRQFDTLVTEGNGDQVRLMKFDGNTWGEPIDVSGPGLDVWRPTVAVDGEGRVVVVWSQNVEGNWDLHARGYDPSAGRWTRIARLTTEPGADVHPVAATDPKTGAVYVAWQGWREGNFDILLVRLDGTKPAGQKRLSQSEANEWCPSAAFDSKGQLHVAFDTYEKGNYDVIVVSGADGGEPRTLNVADSALFEARPTIAVDGLDRVWVAYEEAGPNWGKDFGTRWMGPSGEAFYLHRNVVIRCVEGGQVKQAAGVIPAGLVAQRYPEGQSRRISVPRLAVDASGRLWLLYRRHPRTSGGGEIWTSFVTYHSGDGWVDPVRLANSENLLDNRPAVIPLASGVLVVHSTDGRTTGTNSAEQNDLYCSVAHADGAGGAPALAARPERESVEPVHPSETEEISRLRDYRATIGGKTYRLLRGEFHRHTELTSHRDQDGLLEEIWRYGLDVARMDWLGNGDHDNGYGVEYLWWLVQKQTDIYHHPPVFTPMFTYERSVRYPSGHRNAMFAYRGVRPLPRIPDGDERLYGTPEEGSPDIKTFFAYLRHFDGICASHTSGTNMGTDWRDFDPQVEPVVEIYQGHRQNYEHEGAPGSAKGPEDSIGGYQPAGFVWNALKKGYRLGFQVSSDHVSTHLSYAVVFAEDTSREAIHDAFKKRHCYGANDNIVLDVRCGDNMMGDQFMVRGKPELEIRVIGTAPIARLSIIRGVGRDTPIYVYDMQPSDDKVRFTWTDNAPVWGKTNYYYVRVEQVRPAEGAGALAWASPMWIDVQR